MISRDRAAHLLIMLAATLLPWELVHAQTPTNLSVVSGNGQLACPNCQSNSYKLFEPLVVRVTDANGNPVASAAVNWTVTLPGPSALALQFPQTTTGSDGLTSNTVSPATPGTAEPYQVVASLPNAQASATFYLTQGGSESSSQYDFAQVGSPLPITLNGAAGSTATSPIQVNVQNFQNQPVPNISVRLAPASGYTPGASVSCATGNGADPGSVLTGTDGAALCIPVFGPVASPAGTQGTYQILVGGVSSAQLNGTGPMGYQVFNSVYIQVSPGTPGAVRLLSGNNQSANAGQGLAAPLVAEIDSLSSAPLAGEAVSWSVTPAGAATLSQPSTTSDSNGQVSSSVTLGSNASGMVQITVTTSNHVSGIFTVNVNPPVTGLTKASGDDQAAAINAAFAQPLIVQVNTAAGQNVSGIPVQFTITGPGTLNNTMVPTDNSGRAGVAVTAGATTGAVTVTASAGGYSVTFTLTVAPPGPSLTQNGVLNGAGFYATDATHSALSPCAIGTIFAPGIAPGLQGVVASPGNAPLPYQLAGVSVSFNNSQAPLYNVANINGTQQVAFQVPCDVVPSSTVPVTVTVNGVSSLINLAVRSAGPGIFQYAMSDGIYRAVLAHADGSVVSLENPAHRGETISLYATGIGQVLPSLYTNMAPLPGIDSIAIGQMTVNVNNAGVNVVSARRFPGLIGVDEVTFQLPSNAPTGNDVPLSISVAAIDDPQSPQYSNATEMPIQ